MPRNPKLITRFSLISGSAETAVSGFDERRSGRNRSSDRARPSLDCLPGGRTAVTLDADKFEKYLGEEGLERIIGMRRERGEGDKPGREVFSRSAKTLVIAGDGGAQGFDRVLGLTLELVLLKDPRKRGPNQPLPIELL